MTIIQQPDSLSFSGNIKKIIFSATETTTFALKIGETDILANSYNPGVDGQVEIDLTDIIERQLSVVLPTNGDAVTDQVAGVADFTATIGTESFEFRVIKGGVFDLDVTAEQFADSHFLTWQSQEKRILQVQPEWLTVYAAIANKVVKCKAYYLDGNTIADETATLATVPAYHLQTIDVSWSAICDAITATEPLAWDVWFEDGSSNRLSYIQRLQLRNAASEENMFIWANTLGGVDSAAFTGFLEDDQKLEHQIAELYSEALDEYRINKKAETKQSTGFLTTRESVWLRDFFYSRRRYKVEMDGSVRSIVLVDSKVVSSTADDLHEYEFSYRYTSDNSLLNLDRVVTDLPAPEGLDDFFLTELLAGLPTADYDGNLFFAVQSPFAEGWMKLSLDQLFNQALPEFIDNTTIRFINGKLCTDVGAVIMGLKPKHGFEAATDSVLSFNNSTREFSITAKLGETEIPVWDMGELIKKLTETISITNTAGTWYLYYKDVTQIDQTLLSTLMASLDPWDRDVDIPIATIAWNGSEGILQDYRYLYREINHTPLVRFEDKAHPAEDIYTDTDNFNGLLNGQDTTVQKALEKLDKTDNWKPKHGFESPNTSSLDFNDGSLTFSITAQDVVNFPVWKMGEKLLKATETVAITNAPGWWYIYYKDDLILEENVLMATATAWDRDVDIPIAIIDWNGATGTLKDYRYLYTEINHTPIVRFQDKPHPAEDIYTDITNFDELLDEHDTDLQKVIDKFDDHKHWKLYTPDYLNGFVYTSIVNGIPTLNILGDIIQNGSAYETHAEQVYTKDDLIILRDGALAGLAVGEYAGFKAKLYDGINDGSLVFDNFGIARVGDVGFEQPIATRIETPTNDHFAYWEAANSRLNFKLLDTSFVSENTNLYFTDSRAKAAIYSDLHANYLPYFDGTILTDSGAYWEETAYGVSAQVPGRLLELTSADDYQLRLGDGVTNPLYTYDIGRLSATGHLTFYGNQTGYIGYVFDGVDGQLLHLDNVLATFSGGLKAIFAAATTDTDKFIVSDTGVLKYRTGAEVLSDIGAQAAHANLTSLAGLNYVSASFVKMTAAGTFGLDTAAYDPAGTGHTEATAHVTAHENAYVHANIAHGETAYNWGNHASIGYVTGTPWTGMGYLTSLAHNLAGDVSGAYGSNTVDKIKNKAIAALAAGFLKYDGSGFVFDATPASITGLHANYLPYFNGTILVDSGAYWEETDYGVSALIPGRLLELTSTDDYQIRLGAGVTNPLYSYDIGRLSATGHLTFYGNQTGYIGYVFDGVDGQLLHMDNTMATFSGGINATSGVISGEALYGTNYLQLYTNPKIYLGSNAGTAGQVLISGGASGAAYWGSLSANSNFIQNQTAAAQTASAWINGNFTAAEVYRGSSRKLKKNIELFEVNAIDYLNNVVINQYNLKENGLFGIGFIAEDTHCWLSGADQKSHSFGNHLGILTKAIQEEDKKVEDLKREVLRLKKQVKELQDGRR